MYLRLKAEEEEEVVIQYTPVQGLTRKKFHEDQVNFSMRKVNNCIK
jgi:hypothetical protein